MKPSFNRRFSEFLLPRGALALAALIIAGSIAWVYRLNSGWGWETAIPTGLPAVRLVVDNDISLLSLQGDDESAHTRFRLAASPTGVRDFWLFGDTSGTTSLECVAPGSVPKPGEDGIGCSKSGDAIDISLNKSAAGDGKERRPRHRELWLIPYRQSTFNSLYAPASLHFQRLIQHYRNSTHIVTIYGAECVGAEESENRDKCQLAEEVLGTSTLISDSDPQRFVLAVARRSVRRAVPATILAMLIGDVLLVLFVLSLLGLWISGTRIARPARNGVIVDADTVWRGIRRLLEWLEVLGPAVAFLLTVVGLILAFDRQALTDREGFSAIGAAMSATAVGLLMRVLAFTGDRIIEHLSRWNADPAGLIYPEDFAATIVSGEDANEGAGGARRAAE